MRIIGIEYYRQGEAGIEGFEQKLLGIWTDSAEIGNLSHYSTEGYVKFGKFVLFQRLNSINCLPFQHIPNLAYIKALPAVYSYFVREMSLKQA